MAFVDRETPAPELRSYDTLAINYSRIMSGSGAHCLRPARERKRRKNYCVSAPFFFGVHFPPPSTSHFWARPYSDTTVVERILRGNLRFYRKFIRGTVRASRGAEIERTLYDPRNSESMTCMRPRSSHSSSLQYTTLHIIRRRE